MYAVEWPCCHDPLRIRPCIDDLSTCSTTPLVKRIRLIHELNQTGYTLRDIREIYLARYKTLSNTPLMEESPAETSTKANPKRSKG